MTDRRLTVTTLIVIGILSAIIVTAVHIDTYQRCKGSFVSLTTVGGGRC